MPKLFVLSGPDLGQIHSFTGDVRLGRASSCEIVVRGSSISRAHAALSLDGDAWVIVDLESSNGVHMGSMKAKRFELKDGDLFKLGDVELRFRQGDESDEVAPVLDEELAPASAVVEGLAPAPVAEVSIEEDSDDEELFLEEEIDLGDLTAEVPAPVAPSAPKLTLSVGGAASSEAKRLVKKEVKKAEKAEPLKRAPEGAARRRAAEVSDRREREVLQFSHHRSDSTALTSDLSQQPIWVRALAVLLALGVSAAVFWFAFRGAASLSGEPTFELEDER